LSIHLDLGGVNDVELQENIKSVKFQVWETLHKTLSNEVSEGSLLEKLRRKFESLFKFDEKGLPRVWKPADDIDLIYSQAKDVTERLLLLFSKFDRSLDDFDLDVVNNEVFGIN
jgi:protein SEY1